MSQSLQRCRDRKEEKHELLFSDSLNLCRLCESADHGSTEIATSLPKYRKRTRGNQRVLEVNPRRPRAREGNSRTDESFSPTALNRAFLLVIHGYLGRSRNRTLFVGFGGAAALALLISSIRPARPGHQYGSSAGGTARDGSATTAPSGGEFAMTAYFRGFAVDVAASDALRTAAATLAAMSCSHVRHESSRSGDEIDIAAWVICFARSVSAMWCETLP